MRAGARGRRCGLPRAGLLSIPPLLLALLVGLLLLKVLGEVEEDGGGVAFSVISIEPKRSPHGDGAPSRRPEEEEEEDSRYEDENEMPAQQIGTRGLEVQAWAAGEPSFTAELDRIIAYITRPQVNCSRVLTPGESQASQASGHKLPWLLCAEEWLLPAGNSPCVAYSFSMDGGDADFLQTVLGLGCEVHRFDPSNMNASGGHHGNSLAGSRGDGGVVSHHRMWLEWRALRKQKHKRKGSLGSVSQTLADIMETLGHRTVHFLYADLVSAEWRVFQNWMEHGTVQTVHHLVATMHLKWAGFEVGGTEEEVIRYWFSILQGLRACGFQLVYSCPGEGHSVLKRMVANVHSAYTLSWVNMRH
ncbi:probable methyltransferase-like protein 24 [Lampris incognitus]|uniref:probable methyltransferase-like protein 24 n=1 Tax=Lampris incognitus TaxID=2546036 RepID=UPI0024B510F1|nr:probable methyltransferase-like protein 24 [Lampris incognitus]